MTLSTRMSAKKETGEEVGGALRLRQKKKKKREKRSS